MRGRVGVTVSCGLALGACGLFPDVAALTASDGSVAEASADSGAGDGGDGDTASDATADAPKSPCASTHLFCDDFDQGVLGAKWDSVSINSGPLVLSTTNVVTPPNALEATADPAGQGKNTRLTKHFASAGHTHVELDVLVINPSNTTSTEIDFVSFDLAVPPAGFSYSNLDLQRWQGGTLLEDFAQSDAGNKSLDNPVAETFNAWRHVTLDLDFTAQTFALKLDGVLATTMALTPPVAQTAFDFSIGVTFGTGESAAWNVFIDNVAVDQN